VAEADLRPRRRRRAGRPQTTPRARIVAGTPSGPRPSSRWPACSRGSPAEGPSPS
jgi:hypothetical protein